MKEWEVTVKKEKVSDPIKWSKNQCDFDKTWGDTFNPTDKTHVVPNCNLRKCNLDCKNLNRDTINYARNTYVIRAKRDNSTKKSRFGMFVRSVKSKKNTLSDNSIWSNYVRMHVRAYATDDEVGLALIANATPIHQKTIPLLIGITNLNRWQDRAQNTMCIQTMYPAWSSKWKLLMRCAQNRNVSDTTYRSHQTRNSKYIKTRLNLCLILAEESWNEWERISLSIGGQLYMVASPTVTVTCAKKSVTSGLVKSTTRPPTTIPLKQNKQLSASTALPMTGWFSCQILQLQHKVQRMCWEKLFSRVYPTYPFFVTSGRCSHDCLHGLYWGCQGEKLRQCGLSTHAETKFFQISYQYFLPHT